MTESEFVQLRTIKTRFQAMLIRDNLTKRYHVILDELQKIIDTYLYNDYKQALTTVTNFDSAGVKYMISFISKYENKYGISCESDGNSVV